jgi:phosphate starvation-inducible PhoH-like protein
MSKSARRFQKEDRRPQPAFPMDMTVRREERRDHAPLTPKTENQGRYLNSIKTNDVTFGLGPAGTGKTFVATVWAADQIREKKWDKLIVTRPACEAGDESIGFLPGDISEKFAPYFAPVLAILNERLGASTVEGMIHSGRIEVAPLGFLRGSTFKNSIVLLDEAQNTTPKIMKMFLTRLGQGSKLIIDGDLKQSDISGVNGLWDATKRLDGVKGIGQITFSRDDIVRHGLVRDIIDRYECEEEPANDDDQPGLPLFITGS